MNSNEEKEEMLKQKFYAYTCAKLSRAVHYTRSEAIEGVTEYLNAVYDYCEACGDKKI